MSKIPEGATHTTLNGNGDIYYRRKVDDDWYEYIGRAWRKLIYATPREYTPIQAEPEWSDRGLPQVGMVIEFMKLNAPPKANGDWTKGDVRYLSDCTIVIGGDRCEHVHHPRNLFYRPVQTAEQIAKSRDRSLACDRIYGIITGPGVERKGNTSDMAEALYDAGLRFVEVTK